MFRIGLVLGFITTFVFVNFAIASEILQRFDRVIAAYDFENDITIGVEDIGPRNIHAGFSRGAFKSDESNLFSNQIRNNHVLVAIVFDESNLFSNQIRNNHVPVAIVFLVVVGENVLPIAIIKNVLIYEEERERFSIEYSLDVCNVLKDRDL